MKSIRRGGSVAGRSCSMRPERGQALVEFAIVIPIVILILLGGADLLTAVSAKHNVEYVAEETARCTSAINPPNPNCAQPQVQSYAQSVASSIGMPNSGSLTAQYNSCGVSCISITVQYAASPLFVGFFPSINLSSTAQSSLH